MCVAVNPRFSGRLISWSYTLTEFASLTQNSVQSKKEEWLKEMFGSSKDMPGMFEVLAGSINIMQDRITKSRLKQDPPDFILTPRTGHLGLMEFNRASEAIKEGICCVRENEAILKKLFVKKSKL